MIAVTGHRPSKLGGYDERIDRSLTEFAKLLLPALRGHYGPHRLCIGMALGWDQAVAEAAADLRIPFVAAVPFPQQPSRWPPSARARWERLCKAAAEVHVLEPEYSAEGLLRRNQWMVDRCVLLNALFDGTPGGTAACVRYARLTDRPVLNVWQAWQTHAGGRTPAFEFRVDALPAPIEGGSRRGSRSMSLPGI